MPPLPLTPIETSRIRAALSNLNCPVEILQNGLPGLLASWEVFVGTLPTIRPTHSEFKTAVWIRHLINEVKYQLGNKSYEALNEIIVPLDEHFLDHTAQTRQATTLSPSDKQFDVDFHWYFFRQLTD